MKPDVQQASHTGILVKLIVVVIGMFGFGFAMVPIYNIICDITGINGKTGTLTASEAKQLQVDENRLVTVEFVANLNRNLDWEFRPSVRKMQVHPGKVYETSYYAINRTDERMVGQASYSVAPHEAATHFSKTECFCFTEQPFEAGQKRDMPLRFVIDPRLPNYVETVSLSYTFFDITDKVVKR